MGVFSSGGIGIDMGSGSTAVYLENEGVKLREPTCALVNRENASDVLALGRDAQRMAGRTDDASILVAPVIDGRRSRFRAGGHSDAVGRRKGL